MSTNERPSAVPAGRYPAVFHGVKHEGCFEITGGMHKGEVVRVVFSDAEYADESGEAVGRLLNSARAKELCNELLWALTVFLDDGDGGESAVEVVKNAAAVINAIDLLRIETHLE